MPRTAPALSDLLDPLQHPTMTVEQFATVVPMSRTAAYAAAARGEIPCIRVGRLIRIPTAAVRRMLELDRQGDAA